MLFDKFDVHIDKFEYNIDVHILQKQNMSLH